MTTQANFIEEKNTLPRNFYKAFQRFMVYAILIIGAIIVMFPFVWTLSTSLKYPDDIYQVPPQMIPEDVRWENYSDVLTKQPFGRWMLNSVLVVAVTTFGMLASCSIVAFAFARLRFPGRDILFLIVLATMMLPSQVTLIPTFIMFRWLGWINTYLPITVPAFFARQAFFIFLLRQFFMTIPLDLDDAAHIDGANNFQVFWHIILPMSRPALGVAALMFAQAKWGEFLPPLIYLQKRELLTAAVGLRQFLDPTYGTDWNLMMAANILFMIPIIVTFYFTQRFLIQGIVITGVKG